MRRSTSFDTDQARRLLLKECQYLATLELTTEDDIALLIDAVNLKHRLRDIETDCRYGLHDLAPPNRGGLNSTHIQGTHVPVEEPSTASEAGVALVGIALCYPVCAPRVDLGNHTRHQGAFIAIY